MDLNKEKLLIELMYKAGYNPTSLYMDAAVKELLPHYATKLIYQRVDISTEEGKKRFLELSVSLFGFDGVYKQMRIAPVPSIFINGELSFETIPPRHLLKQAVEESLESYAPGGWNEEGHR